MTILFGQARTYLNERQKQVQSAFFGRSQLTFVTSLVSEYVNDIGLKIQEQGHGKSKKMNLNCPRFVPPRANPRIDATSIPPANNTHPPKAFYHSLNSFFIGF
jgi:hypothetical protein